jgi:Zn-dependent protease
MMELEDDKPPVMTAPPIYSGQQGDEKKPKWAQKLGPLGSALLVVLAKLKSFFYILMSGAKFLKLGKVLLTASTMVVSAWFYALFFGFPFAIGFVITILIHELGHVVAAKYQGVQVSAPIFIPYMGALINKRENAKTAIGEAVIGIGGPIGGTFAGLVCVALFLATHNSYFVALAYVTFMINLFNLTPIYPLDGGRITGAVSPYLWLAGLIIMLGMYLTGFVRNPMILILILMGLPRLWHGLKTGNTHVPGQEPATGLQRIGMGLAYVGLCGFLFGAMGVTHETTRQAMTQLRSGREARTVGSLNR